MKTFVYAKLIKVCVKNKAIPYGQFKKYP